MEAVQRSVVMATCDPTGLPGGGAKETNCKRENHFPSEERETHADGQRARSRAETDALRSVGGFSRKTGGKYGWKVRGQRSEVRGGEAD